MGWAYDDHKHVWVLKHGQKEQGRTWKQLAAMRWFAAAQSTKLGEEGNSPAMVANWRQEWVLWLRDNMAQHTRPSIYRSAKRWCPILKGETGGREERWVTSVNYRGAPRGNASGDKLTSYGYLLRRGTSSKHVVTIASELRWGHHCPLRGKCHGEQSDDKSLPLPRVEIFPCPWLSASHVHESWRSTLITTEGHRRWDALYLRYFCYCTIGISV
jgi:hypothetical protein